MRFLCLHGMGTNSKIFEMQTAAIRHGLGSEHTYEFIDGAVPSVMAPGKSHLGAALMFSIPTRPQSTIKGDCRTFILANVGMDTIVGPDDEFLQYADYDSLESCLKALYDLEQFVDEEGPFDGVIGFSLGATLASSLIVHKLQKDPRKERLQPTFRCAIFFCGGVPEILSMESGEAQRRLLSYEADGQLIEIPTAHVWGANDQLWPTFGKVLCGLCRQDQRAVFIHQGGHEIPGPKDQDALLQAVRVIKRTIERADQQQ